MYFARQGGISVIMQFHDEEGHYIKTGDEENNEKILRSAIDKANEKLKLNVVLDIDIKVGNNYAETH